MTKFLAGAFLLLFSFTAAAQTPEDSVAFAGARWQITPLAAGAECRRAQIDMFGSRQTVSVVAYPARNFTTEIIQLDGKASPTSELGKAAGADAALNGSYFNMKTLAPVTFVLIDKQILGRTTPGETMRTNGVIALRDKRGRKMDILRCDTTQYSASPAVTARRWPQVRCWSATAGASNTTPKTVSTPAATPAR